MNRFLINYAWDIMDLGKANGVDNGVAREMFVDPEKLPLLVVLKGGLRGIFACAGYNVGSVDLAMKLLQK